MACRLGRENFSFSLTWMHVLTYIEDRVYYIRKIFTYVRSTIKHCIQNTSCITHENKRQAPPRVMFQMHGSPNHVQVNVFRFNFDCQVVILTASYPYLLKYSTLSPCNHLLISWSHQTTHSPFSSTYSFVCNISHSTLSLLVPFCPSFRISNLCNFLYGKRYST